MQKINNLLHRNRDANHNGIPDSQERNVYGTNSLNDRNHNGIPDSQERQGPIEKVKNLLHLNKDANHNGIPDSQERGVYGNNALLPQGVPQQNLGYKRSLHQELLGRNGMWNLRKAQTRSYFPRDYYNMETGFEREWAQSGQSQSLLTRQAPINLERVEKEVVVHEHIHPVEKEEIQPVIYREREQLDIKQITQQLHETQIQPTFVQKRELAPEYREAIVERGAPIQENLVLPTVDRDVTLKSQVVHAPIVNETIKRTVIEEIQPVLERDIIQSTLIQETKNIYEKVIEAPTVYRETTVIQDRGINGGSLSALSAQGFNLGSYYSGSNDVNMNGIPDNLERNTQFGNDRNMNGIPDNLEGGMRHNPLDRNHDGRVNLQDLKSTDRNHNGIPDSQERLGQQGFAGGLNDRNMNGIPDSQERFGAKTLNPLDRNNDGKVDLKDLTANKQQAPLRAL